MRKEQVTIQFGDLGSVTIYSANTDYPSLWLIGEDEARENGEATVQIAEGLVYEYSFDPPSLQFSKSNSVVSWLRSQSGTGTISPNTLVGTLALEVARETNVEIVDRLSIEVRSVKSTYRTDYRTMLEDIAERATDLLMQINSPVSQSFLPNFGQDSHTDYQKFSFVNAFVSSAEFDEAMARILALPATAWTEEPEERDIRKVRRVSGRALSQFASSNSRFELPLGHPLKAKGIDSVPSKLSLAKKIDSVDTPENRFVRHALTTFLSFCSDFAASVENGSRAAKEARLTIEKLESSLQHSFFSDVSSPSMLRIDSPTLQRRAGYREILKYWLMFELAAQLIWEGGDDVYAAGKRNVATLYEYWLFFVLLEVMDEVFSVRPESIDSLWRKTDDGLALQLKQNKRTVVKGVFESGGRKLEVRLNYNRSFSGGRRYPNGGSWTTTLRPDYTLSIWPQGISLRTAEEEELITHVHFDAKYKIDKFVELLKNAGSEEPEDVAGPITFKNADLLKMHAYRDAIRRTSGAYILYPGSPGTDDPEPMRGFREIVPGLGAFPIQPSRENSGIDKLKAFIEELVEHLLDRTSQRERVSYRVWEIHRDRLPSYKKTQKPEPISYLREVDPDSTYVLVGLRKDSRHIAWMERNHLYNLRRGNRGGAIEITEKEIAAEYILFYDPGETITGKIKRIFGPRPRVYDSQMMKMTGYEVQDSNYEYTVFAITEDVEEDFKNKTWDLGKLERFAKNDPYGKPFVITLSELIDIEST